jgi:hypothetical protein
MFKSSRKKLMMVKKLEWFSVDNQEQFKLNKTKLKKYGWVNKDGTPVAIEYHINKQNFRHDGTHKGYVNGGVMYVGDSEVFGVGNCLKDTLTYKAHYSSNLSSLPYYNFGVPSRGIETYYRIIKEYISKIKPHTIVLIYPWESSRSEVWDVNKKDFYYIHLNTELKRNKISSKALMNMFDEVPSTIRLNKNLEAIRWLCHTHNTQFIYIEKLPKDNEPSARDLVHHGREWHEEASKELTLWLK